MELEELQAAQAMLSVLGHLIREEPVDVEVISMADQGLFASAPYGAGDSNVQKGFALMNEWLVANVVAPESGETEASVATRQENLNALRRDWLQLIAGVGMPKAPSWAGFYLSEEHATFSAETLVVRRIYKRYNMELVDKHADPDDHLGIMMGFIAHLIGLELEGTDTTADQQFLIEDRILPWLPTWLYYMDKEARTDYFRGLGYAVFGLVSAFAQQRYGIKYDAEKQAFFK